MICWKKIKKIKSFNWINLCQPLDIYSRGEMYFISLRLAGLEAERKNMHPAMNEKWLRLKKQKIIKNILEVFQLD